MVAQCVLLSCGGRFPFLVDSAMSMLTACSQAAAILYCFTREVQPRTTLQTVKEPGLACGYYTTWVNARHHCMFLLGRIGCQPRAVPSALGHYLFQDLGTKMQQAARFITNLLSLGACSYLAFGAILARMHLWLLVYHCGVLLWGVPHTVRHKWHLCTTALILRFSWHG